MTGYQMVKNRFSRLDTIDRQTYTGSKTSFDGKDRASKRRTGKKLPTYLPHSLTSVHNIQRLCSYRVWRYRNCIITVITITHCMRVIQLFVNVTDSQSMNDAKTNSLYLRFLFR